MRAAAGLSFALLLLAGCPHPRPPPSLGPPPPLVRIPDGCDKNLSGTYAHRRDPSFRYLGEDDGGTLTLALEREAGDAGSAPLRIVLHRTADGFLGLTHASAFNAAHRLCPLDVPTEVTACPDDGLTLATLDRIDLDADCGFSRAKAERVEEPLRRISDAGVDAGSAAFR